MPPLPARFEPGSIGDPVANVTEWGPCKGGGASFCTHVLMDGERDRVAFRPTIQASLFYAAFFLGGLGALAGFVASFFGAGDHGIVVPLLPFGLIFGGIGVGLLWFGMRPIVFDRKQGLFWKAWGKPRPGLDPCVELKSIHALQVISEYCGGKSSYDSYELNLVLSDGTRLNIVDHGDLKRVRRDGATLARFLGVPLWDPVQP